MGISFAELCINNYHQAGGGQGPRGWEYLDNLCISNYHRAGGLGMSGKFEHYTGSECGGCRDRLELCWDLQSSEPLDAVIPFSSHDRNFHLQ